MRTNGIGAHRTMLQQVEGFRVIMDDLPEGCSVIDFDWRYVFANKIVGSRLGLDPKKIIGKRITDLLPNIKNNRIYPVIDRCLKERKHGHVETEVPRGTSTVSIDFIVRPIAVGAFILTIDKTKQRKAEAELLNSEEAHRSFMDRSPLLVLIYQDGILKYANKCIIDRLGYSFEELTDPSLSPIDRIIAPRFRKDAMKNRAKVRAEKFVPRHESALITRTGEEIDVVVSSMALTFNGKEAREIVLEDVTDLRKADRALRESEEEYRSFMDNSPLFVTINQDGVCKYVNRTVTDRLGYSFEEIADPSFSAIDTWVVPEYRKQAHANREKREKGETIPRTESRLVTRSGEEIDIIATMRFLTFQGKPAIEYMMEDITEQKRADKAREESETMYRRLFHSSAVGNWSQDLGAILKELDILKAEGIKDFRTYFHTHPVDTKRISRSMKMLEINQTALEMFGASSTKELLMGASHLFSKVSLEDGIEFLVAVIEGAQSYGMDFSCNTLDGRDIEIRTLSNITPRVKGSQLMIVNAIDVTESKRHEAEKLSAVGKAAASIAHDVRNPLTAIRNAAYIIRSAEKEKRNEMLEVIDNNTVRADNIIQSLMDFSSPAPLEATVVNFNTVLDEIVTQTVIPNNVKLNKKYEGNLATRVDVTQMTRAFTNLIMNAIQAMPKGGRLTISSKQVDGFIETQITDTGVGVPKKNIPKLFTPFFTTKAKGTGLGLPNAEAIVKRHKGTLIVESIEKESTTITARLPALDK